MSQILHTFEKAIMKGHSAERGIDTSVLTIPNFEDSQTFTYITCILLSSEPSRNQRIP